MRITPLVPVRCAAISRPSFRLMGPLRPPEELVAWLTEGHGRWLASVRALESDAELDRERLANWGELLPTRALIRIMIAHDFYHAGEINHLRALIQVNDRWEYD